MKNRIHIKNISELFFLRQSDNETNNGVNCITVDYQTISTQFSSAIYPDAFISILVLSGEVIYRRVKYGVRLYNTPVIRLNRSNAATLCKGISVIDKTLNNTRHFYYKEKVLNNIFNFYLDLSDIIERKNTM